MSFSNSNFIFSSTSLNDIYRIRIQMMTKLKLRKLSSMFSFKIYFDDRLLQLCGCFTLLFHSLLQIDVYVYVYRCRYMVYILGCELFHSNMPHCRYTYTLRISTICCIISFSTFVLAAPAFAYQKWEHPVTAAPIRRPRLYYIQTQNGKNGLMTRRDDDV